jgi:putative FmdB family regulatory protein
MPLFEYICNSCHKRFTVLVGMTAQRDSDACPHCGSAQATKKVTRFAQGRTEGALDDHEPPGDIDDPRAMRRWAKEMGQEMGEDLGDDFDEYMDSAEDGEDDYE